MQKSESPLERQIDIEIIGKTARVGRVYQVSIFIDHAEWKPGSVFRQVNNIRLSDQASNQLGSSPLGQRGPAPGHEAVGGVPRKRTRTLRRKNRVFQAVVDHGIRACAGPRVARRPLETAERAPYREFGGIITIVPPVAELVQSPGRHSAKGFQFVDERESATS